MLRKVLFFLLFFASWSNGQEIAIRAGNLIDPATGAVAKNQIVLIKNGKIVEVGPRVQVPQTARNIDLSNAWVMPGLMDAHVHLTFGQAPADSGFGLMQPYLTESSGFRALRGMANAQAVLQAGFTTVKDIGNDANYAAIDVRRAIERNWFMGPTMLTTGKIIAAFGGQSQNITPEQGPFWQFEYLDADTPDEIRKAVRRNIYYGANAIKLMKEKGTVLVGTDFPKEHLEAIKFNQAVDGKTFADRIIDRLSRAHKLGVKMAFGTDIFFDLPNKTRGTMAWDYLDVWVAAGIPAPQILKCMTTNAAELFQIQKQRGAIAAGLAADIIAAPENPLDNIQALRKVSFVMKDGKTVK